MREYWLENGFIEMHSPKIMGAPSESGAELFSLKYFETTAYLAQSPQFYKQMAMAAGYEKVFEIGPVFRADPSFTSALDRNSPAWTLKSPGLKATKTSCPSRNAGWRMLTSACRKSTARHQSRV